MIIEASVPVLFAASVWAMLTGRLRAALALILLAFGLGGWLYLMQLMEIARMIWR